MLQVQVWLPLVNIWNVKCFRHRHRLYARLEFFSFLFFFIQETDTLNIEKKNLISIFKLVVKDLIDISLKSTNRHIDKQSAQLQHFYEIFDNILNHGFKGKKGFGSYWSRNKDFSILFDLIAHKCDVNNCLSSVRDINEIK